MKMISIILPKKILVIINLKSHINVLIINALLLNKKNIHFSIVYFLILHKLKCIDFIYLNQDKKIIEIL